MLTPEMIAELRSLAHSDGSLHTKDVVELARKPSSALHKHPAFEWDVNKAALKQWMESARSVIQVYVGIVDDLGDSKQMRMYIHTIDANKHPIYRPTQRVLRENRSVVINMVCDRILSVIKNYPLSEFTPVIELVEEIRDEANVSKTKTRRKRKGGRLEARV